MTRCEPRCVLESEEGATLELPAFLARLRRCQGCPHAEASDPLVRRLWARSREAARAHRKLAGSNRKLAQEAEDNRHEALRFADRVAKLERLQQVSSEQIERELERERARVRERDDEIEALSVPLIRVWSGVIALPVIGELTATRARILTERLLDEVARAQIHTPIIDLTGVANLDTATANHVISMFAALRLLGARPILTGVTPNTARTLVTLGVALDGILTLPSVHQALEYTLAERAR